jgi:hypothetical protein
MLLRWVIAPAVLLCAATARADAASQADAAAEATTTLSRSDLKAGQVYEFRTTGRTYRAEVLDARAGECLVSASHDGLSYSKPRKAFLLGATHGPESGVSLVLMGQVKVGLGIELAIEDYSKANRFLTPDVTAITLVHP